MDLSDRVSSLEKQLRRFQIAAVVVPLVLFASFTAFKRIVWDPIDSLYTGRPKVASEADGGFTVFMYDNYRQQAVVTHLAYVKDRINVCSAAVPNVPLRGESGRFSIPAKALKWVDSGGEPGKPPGPQDKVFAVWVSAERSKDFPGFGLSSE